MRRLLPLLLFALAGCARDPAPTAASTPAAQEAEARIGDVVVHASAVQTSMLDAGIAAQYGLDRSDQTVMLLVSARRADGGDALPAPLSISATAAPDGGGSQPLVLREVRVGNDVDRVGTIEIAPPQSLRFDVVVRYGTSTSTMQVSRNFFPR